jgi:hypothetical protein
MDAQVETGILQVARCCFRKAQGRRRDLGTLGLCGLHEGAACCPDLISGADRQRHTLANFPQAGEQFWRVGHRLSVLSVKALLFSPRYFAHHYFHPNTPSLATQDIPVSTDHVGVSGTVHLA